ncbi:MAG: hypothetical protein CL677_05500 [Bdellovibrionaceae bacterium]|nr:hypothetical protein [Pseudobdellovibrionaceae bacterium]
MSDKRLLILNYFCFVVYGIFTIGFQTSIWSQVLGGFPPPHFWLPVLAYWSLYRSPKEGLIMTYLITLLVASVTAMPLGMFLLLNIILYALSYTFKSKFYQPGPIFFAIICGAMSVAFMPIHFILSLIIEPTPIQDLEIIFWLLQSLLTPLLSFAVYPIFCIIDDLTNKELPTEVGRQFE